MISVNKYKYSSTFGSPLAVHDEEDEKLKRLPVYVLTCISHYYDIIIIIIIIITVVVVVLIALQLRVFLYA